MTRPRSRWLLVPPLVALLCGTALRAVAPTGHDKPAGAAPGPAPDGPRLRLGTGHFRHGGGLMRIYPLPDGRRLLTIAADLRARVWDIATEKQLVEITLATERGYLVYSPAPDGTALAGANAADRTLRVWSLADGKETLRFAALGPDQEFTDLEYSPDGKRLLSAHQDRVLRVWDAVAGKQLRQLGRPDGPRGIDTRCANFFPDGRAAAAVDDWVVRAFDVGDGKELRWFGGHTAPVARFAFAPDGKRMATVAADRAARVWDLATGQTVARLPLPPGGASDVAFTPDGKTLVVCCADSAVRLFDLADDKHPSRSIAVGPPGARHCALSPDGKTLYVDGGESVVRGYDLATGKELYPAAGHVGAVMALAWSPDGKLLATSGHTDRSIILWDAVTGRLVRQLPALEDECTAGLQFAADGKALLSYGDDRTLRVWDVARGRELRAFVTAPRAPLWQTLSPDGRLAAVVGADRTVRVWDVAGGKELHVLDVPARESPRRSRGSSVVVFAGDNRTLLLHDDAGRVTRRYDAVAGRELGAAREGDEPLGVWPAQSGDGRMHVLTTGLVTSLVETATAQVRQTFTMPASPTSPDAYVLAAAVSRDGRTVASLASDGVLRFWDGGSGKMLAERRGLLANTRLLAFAPDGMTLASGGHDTGALLWDVPGPAAEGRFVPPTVTPAGLGQLWKELEGDDAPRAWQALLSLAAAPKEAVPLVRKQLDPASVPDAKQVARWITDLDAEAFADREKATEELIRAGRAAEAAARKALATDPPAEVRRRLDDILSKLNAGPGPSRDEVRAARAVELLEKIGNAEARRLLEEFAKGGDGPLSIEARSALARLKARDPAR
jgi:WD40 repeat protein